ncbi:hypothetical protein [Thermococcus sp.]|uniref:hypothetical protein n=1 Tax=Thermococcus sp. TaxID=35749 RepID=UPI00261A5EE1|nr:hypothetical protein [Thermococcus sp.]
MKRRAQTSLEFVFMMAGGSLVALFVIRRFITARASAIHVEGHQINTTVNRTTDVLESMISTP